MGSTGDGSPVAGVAIAVGAALGAVVAVALALALGWGSVPAPASWGSPVDATLGPALSLHQISDHVEAPRVLQRRAKPRGECCFSQASASA